MVAWGVVFVSEFNIGRMRCRVEKQIQQKLIIIVLKLQLHDLG